MKIGIIGDTHIGAAYALGKTDPKTQLNSRLIDFSNTFNGIIDTFISRQVELVVLTGDIFESRHPTSAQLNALCKCLKRAVNLGLEIVVVVGNHDQQRNIETSTVDILDHLDIPRVSVFANPGLKTITKDGKNINLILLPYRDRRMINAFTNSEAIATIKSNLSDLIQGQDGIKILVGHLMLESTEEAENPDSFSINELVLPFNTFEGFDAVLMGHVHCHKIMPSKSPVIIYTGSMEKVSFGEKEHTKVSIVLDTDDIANFEILKTAGVRNLYELNFDYIDGDKVFKSAINDKMIEDINTFNDAKPLKDAIIKFVAKVKDTDLYHVNHQKIKEHLLSKEPNNLVSIQISSTSVRQLRNSSITEDINSKTAMTKFIKNLADSDKIKKKLQKYSEQIIDDIEGK